MWQGRLWAVKSLRMLLQPGREEKDTYQQVEARGVSEREAMSVVHL